MHIFVVSRRFDYANHARRLVEDVWDNTDDLDDDDDGEVAMDDAPIKKTYKPGRYYRNQVSHKNQSCNTQ